MCYVWEDPHKDRGTKVCVCVCVSKKESETKQGSREEDNCCFAEVGDKDYFILLR